MVMAERSLVGADLHRIGIPSRWALPCNIQPGT
jgi:hypothetical protein